MAKLQGIELPEETIAPGVEDVLGYAAEYRVVVPSTYLVQPADEPVLIIGIAAVGGGTVGQVYADQEWLWDLWADEVLVASGRDLRSGAMGATHEQMARTLATFLSNDGEAFYYGYQPEAGNASVDYVQEAVEVLAGAWEQLGLFASDDD
jgi:hypothetical protein